MSISETFDLLTYLYTNVSRIYRELLILEKATASSRIMYDVSNWVFFNIPVSSLSSDAFDSCKTQSNRASSDIHVY